MILIFQAITGCGHLIFEILRGVSGKFHSCVETFLPVLFDVLKDTKINQEILFKVLTQTAEDSLQTISPKEYAIFWDCIQKVVEEILNNEDDNKGLEYILRLAGQVIQHQKGKYLLNPPQFVLLLVKVISEQTAESILEVCSQIGALLLLSTNISLAQEHAGIIIKVLLPLPYRKILIEFVQNVIEYSQFDMHILPPFINFVIQSNFDDEAMKTLAKVCLAKSPLSKNGIRLFEWVKYPIDFGKNLALFMEHFTNIFNEEIGNIVENPTKLMNMLFCMPHIEKVDVDYCIRLLNQLITKLIDLLSSHNLESQLLDIKLHYDTTPLSKHVRKILFILTNTLECAVHISSCRKLKEICDIDVLLPVVLPCAADPNYVAALHLLDLYLTAYEQENGLSFPFLSLVDSYLKCNISSPFHIVSIMILA